MILAFALFRYFPFGGLQRDFLRIALECQRRGHLIRIYSTAWQGDRPDGFDIQQIAVSGSLNHSRMVSFQKAVHRALQKAPADVLVGFNKMAGLDIYYAADTCYKDKTAERNWLYKRTTRYKTYCTLENAIFGAKSRTVSLLISKQQKPIFQHHYQTPNSRIQLLPPGISKDRCRPDNADSLRQAFRRECELKDNDKLILMVGSGFKTKGLDRAITAVAALPAELKERSVFYIVGQDKQAPFLGQAKKLGISNRIRFFSGRDDVLRFLLGADLLIHPAYNENTGTVLLEALVSGLPVLTTDICGYAHYITDARAGQVVPSPFQQDTLNQFMIRMLISPEQSQWRKNAVNFSRTTDLYSMPEKASDVIVHTARENAKRNHIECST